MNVQSVFLRTTLLPMFLACACPASVWSQEPVGKSAAPAFIFIPDQIVWNDIEEFPGLQVAMGYGDPSQTGLYVMYAKFEPGIMTAPHFHSADRWVTVISGTWWATIGEEETPEATKPLSPGQSMFHPAGTVHFDGAHDETAVVQIVGVGPVTTEYADEK